MVPYLSQNHDSNCIHTVRIMGTKYLGELELQKLSGCWSIQFTLQICRNLVTFDIPYGILVEF